MTIDQNNLEFQIYIIYKMMLKYMQKHNSTLIMRSIYSQQKSLTKKWTGAIKEFKL